MGRLADYLIGHLTINFGGRHQLQITEKVQGAVNGGPIDRRRRGMDTIVDLGHGGVIANGTEGIHDDLALRRQAVALIRGSVCRS